MSREMMQGKSSSESLASETAKKSFVASKTNSLAKEEGFIGESQDNLKNLAGYPASMTNLLKTIVGSGMLTLPWAFSMVGYIPGLALLALAALLSAVGLHLLTVAATNIGRKSSFAGLCKLTYPRAVFFFELAIAIKCLGAAVSYLNIIGQSSSTLFKSLNFASASSVISQPWFWTVIAAVAITPICLMRKMDSLKYTSFLGLIGVFYLVFLSVFFYFTKDSAVYPSSFASINAFASISTGSFKSFSNFVFAFTCHQNILPIQNESRKNSPRAMMNIISACISTAMTIYVIFALFGYAALDGKMAQTALDAYPKAQTPYIIARMLYVFLLLCSFPLQIFPCRNSVEKMIIIINDEFAQRQSVAIYWVSSFAIVGLSAFLGSLPLGIPTINGFIGSTVGSFICYFLPAIVYNKMYSGTPFDLRRISAVVLIIAGCVTTLVGLPTNIYDMIANKA